MKRCAVGRAGGRGSASARGRERRQEGSGGVRGREDIRYDGLITAWGRGRWGPSHLADIKLSQRVHLKRLTRRAAQGGAGQRAVPSRPTVRRDVTAALPHPRRTEPRHRCGVSGRVGGAVRAGVLPSAPFDSLVTGKCRREGAESRMSPADRPRPRPRLRLLQRTSPAPCDLLSKAESRGWLGAFSSPPHAQDCLPI